MDGVHDDQITVSREQVALLIADELPALAGSEIAPIDGGGTANAIFRIGDRVTARFPLRDDDPDCVRTHLHPEMTAAAEFRLACPVPSPTPLHIGSPAHGYPALPWATESWLPGTPVTPAGHKNSQQRSPGAH